MHVALKVLCGVLALLFVTSCLPRLSSGLSTKALIRLTGAVGILTAGYLTWFALAAAP